MNKHIEGRPVSSSTYCNHGCRCDDCRAAHAVYMRKMRQKGRSALWVTASSKANAAAAAEFRRRHPGLYKRILDKAKAEVGL